MSPSVRYRERGRSASDQGLGPPTGCDKGEPSVLVNPTPEQEFFRETTAKFLEQVMPVETIRRLRDDPAGFDPAYWRRGCELGWTSLLVAEEHGGGSLSGSGVVDLTLVAHEFGAHAAPGPLAPTNLVAAALSDAGSHADVLAGVLTGGSIAGWCEGTGTLAMVLDGEDIVLDGTVRAVESAGQANHLLTTGNAPEGITQVLVPTDTGGVSMKPMHTVDLTRRFWQVRFDAARAPLDAVVGSLGGAGATVEWQRQLALVLANAEMVGAMQRAFDLTVEWSFDRYSFGRPLASYQELKHRFADMKTWLEASHAVSDAAAISVGAAAAEATELLSVAKSYIGDYGSELLQDCIQVHGGIGLTFEHDIHLYLRRHTLNRGLYGTPREHRRRIALLGRQSR
jgi:alkylation response protein AidB-like acyl-CoA dehydrogenase